MVKKIAVYGSYEAKVPVRQRYSKTREAYQYMRKGKLIEVPEGKQRYWKTIKRTRKVIMSGRYEFHGRGRDLYKAVVKAHRIMPRKFIDVSAEKFLEHPEKYGIEGEWIDKEVESG